MADELGIKVKAIIDTSDIPNQLDKLNKKSSNNGTIQIGVKLDAKNFIKENQSKIDYIQKGIRNIPVHINISIDENDSIKGISAQLDKIGSNINPIMVKLDADVDGSVKLIKESIKKINSQLDADKIAVGKKSSGSTKTAKGDSTSSVGMDISAIPQKYKESFDAQIEKAKKDLVDSGAKIVSSKITYDTGSDAYKGVVEYKTAIGDLVSATIQLNKATDEYNVTQISSKSNFEAVGKEIEKVAQNAAKYESALSKLNTKATTGTHALTGDYKTQYDKLVSDANNAISEYKSGNKLNPDLSLQIEKYFSDIDNLITEAVKNTFVPTKMSSSDIQSAVRQYQSEIRKFESEVAAKGFGNNADMQDRISAIRGTLSKPDINASDIQGVTDALREARKELDALNASSAKDSAFVVLKNQIAGTISDLDSWKNKYGSILDRNPELLAKIEELKTKFSSVNNAADFKKLRSEMTALGKEIRNQGSNVSTFGAIFRKSFGEVGGIIASYVSITRLLSYSIRIIRSMINEVVDLDASLVELQKVSDLTGNSLNAFVDRAYEAGRAIGRTGKEVIDATTVFKRAGYDIEESLNLARTALIMTNVGDGINNAEEAASSLIAVLKGYKMEASEAGKVLDIINEISNTQPVDFSDITESLKTVSGTLAQTGTTLEQTAALFVGGFGQLRNEETVSSGLIMISQRLRGIKEDGESVVGLAPKMQKAFKRVAGIDITDGNGELRSTFEILQDLQSVWGKLNTQQRQYLGELAAGNRQVKVLNAIMNDWESVEASLVSANNSIGSAAKENDKFLNSIQGKVNDFKTAFSSLANTTIESETIKGVVSFGTEILRLTDSLGGLQVVLPTIFPLIKTLRNLLKGGAVGTGSWISMGIGAIVSIYNYFSNKKQQEAEEYIRGLEESVERGKKAVEGLNDLQVAMSVIQQYGNVDIRTADQENEFNDAIETATSLIGTKAEALEGLVKGTKQYKDILVDLTDAEIKQRNADLSAGLIASRSVLDSMSSSDSEEYKSTHGVQNKEDVGKQESAVTMLKSLYPDMNAIYGIGHAVGAKYTIEEYFNAIEILDNIINSDYVQNDGKIIDENIKYLYDFAENYKNTYQQAVSDYLGYLIQSISLEMGGVTSYEDVNKVASKLIESVIGAPVGENGAYSRAQMNAVNMMPDFVASYFPQIQSVSAESSDIIADVSELGVTFDMLASYMYNLNTATEEEYKSIQAVINEQEQYGRISVATYNDLISKNEDFVNLLEQTADGYRINEEALQEYMNKKNLDTRMKAIKEIMELELQMTDADDEQKKQLQAQINQWGLIVREIDNATSAYNRYVEAGKTQNQDSMFQTAVTMGKDYKENLEIGKVGTDDFKTSVEFALGEDWKTAYEDSAEAYKVASEKFERYTGQEVESDNIINFLQDLQNQGLGSMRDGVFEFGDNATVENMANALGISQDFVLSMLGLMEAYGADIKYLTEVSEKDIERYKQYQKENAKQLQEQADANNKEIEQAKSEIVESPQTQEEVDRNAELINRIGELESANAALQSEIDAVSANIQFVNDFVNSGVNIPASLDFSNAPAQITTFEEGNSVSLDTSLDNLTSDEVKAFEDANQVSVNAIIGSYLPPSMTDEEKSTALKSISPTVQAYIEKYAYLNGTVPDASNVSAFVSAYVDAYKFNNNQQPDDTNIIPFVTAVVEGFTEQWGGVNADNIVPTVIAAVSAFTKATGLDADNIAPVVVATVEKFVKDWNLSAADIESLISSLTAIVTAFDGNDASIANIQEMINTLTAYVATIKASGRVNWSDVSSKISNLIAYVSEIKNSTDGVTTTEIDNKLNGLQAFVNSITTNGTPITTDVQNAINNLKGLVTELKANGADTQELDALIDDLGATITSIDGTSADVTMPTVEVPTKINVNNKLGIKDIVDADFDENGNAVLHVVADNGETIYEGKLPFESPSNPPKKLDDWEPTPTKDSDYGLYSFPIDAVDGFNEILDRIYELNKDNPYSNASETASSLKNLLAEYLNIENPSGEDFGNILSYYEKIESFVRWLDKSEYDASMLSSIEMAISFLANPVAYKTSGITDAIYKKYGLFEEPIEVPVEIDEEEAKGQIENVVSSAEITIPVKSEADETSVTKTKDLFSELMKYVNAVSEYVDDVNFGQEYSDAYTQKYTLSDVNYAESYINSAKLFESAMRGYVVDFKNAIANGNDEDANEAFDGIIRSAQNAIHMIEDENIELSFGGNFKDVDAKLNEIKSKVIVVNAELRWTASDRVVPNIVPNKELSAYAHGTIRAKKEQALVDDGGGAELIEHVSKGTYELGTDDGARLTMLERGDIVHDAAETKQILKRRGFLGKFFRNGTGDGVKTGHAYATVSNVIKKVEDFIGLAASTIAQNAAAKINTSTALNTSTKGSSFNTSFIDKVDGSGTGNSGGSKKSAKKTTKALKDYLGDLYDWIEVRIARLTEATNRWVNNAKEAIEFIDKNSELDKALSNTSIQIETATKAYERYMQEAETIAQQYKISNDIIQKIQQGEIDIESYDDATREKIDAYKKYYDAAVAVKDSLYDLRAQERELATTKLQNIVDYYDKRIEQMNQIVKLSDSRISLKGATGARVLESDYADAILATQKIIDNYTMSQSALSDEFERMISEGHIVEGSEEWWEYSKALKELDINLVDAKSDLQGLIDEANNIVLTNLKYALDMLTASADSINNMMNLHEAQGVTNEDTDYESLIRNGMQQIANLEAQNAELLKQQEGLDELSEKWQDLQSRIDSNNNSIMSMKKSQEEWNDAVLDLDIRRLEKYKEELNKISDQYERQRKMQEAIEEVERARTQRTARVYREGKYYAPLCSNTY